jgi:uncharacterized membrane protein
MVNLSLILLTVLNIFDILSTWILIGSYGYCETNPVIAHMISQVGLSALLIKLLFLSILVIFRDRLYKFRYMLYFATVVYLICMIKYNIPMVIHEIF